MFIEVTGPARDLHSGVFGRTVHEPMTDLVILLGKLVAPDGTILIPGVDDMVRAADNEERYEVNTQLLIAWLKFLAPGNSMTASTTPSLTLKKPSAHPSPCQMTRFKSSWAG
jgi:hypothetical protein